ncbi:MAG: hypothetical protein CSA86_02090 [Arcobacter sp.]|nr:MAG: hypothetical protein CSA86_02090 [Arcobacter sp.]
MNQTLVKKIQSNPNYIELVQKRNGLALKLSLFVLAIFYGFILVIAFSRETLGTLVSTAKVEVALTKWDATQQAFIATGETVMQTPVLTWAFPVAAAIIIVSFITTLIYVTRANGEFEDLTNAVKEDVKDDL